MGKGVENIFHDDPSYDQLKNQLGVILTEEGILRCRGRLKHSKLRYSKKFPALLPSDSHVTALIIQQCHERVFHNKTRGTLYELIIVNRLIIGGKRLLLDSCHLTFCSVVSAFVCALPN